VGDNVAVQLFLRSRFSVTELWPVGVGRKSGSRARGLEGTQGPLLGVRMCLGVGLETLSPRGYLSCLACWACLSVCGTFGATGHVSRSLRIIRF